jgi:uncharacterized protein (TIGR03067 family)
MRKTTSALLALCALAALAGRADEAEPPDDAKQALKKLKGKWTVTKALLNKRELRAPIGGSYTFDGDKLTRETPQWRAEVVRTTFKVKIDTRRRPHRIELTDEGGGGQVGIYKIEKGQLYLALGRPKDVKGDKDPAVPTDFKGEARPVYVMKREKVEEKKGKEKAKE